MHNYKMILFIFNIYSSKFYSKIFIDIIDENLINKPINLLMKHWKSYDKILSIYFENNNRIILVIRIQ